MTRTARALYPQDRYTVKLSGLADAITHLCICYSIDHDKAALMPSGSRQRSEAMQDARIKRDNTVAAIIDRYDRAG